MGLVLQASLGEAPAWMIITVPCDVVLFPPKEDLGSLLTLLFSDFPAFRFHFSFSLVPTCVRNRDLHKVIWVQGQGH